MKRVELERQAIVKALHHAPNITAAAEELGASRRTLQTRMRDYGIPPGEPGRPRSQLPKSSGMGAGTLLGLSLIDDAIILLVAGGAWWLHRKKKAQAVAGALPSKPDCLRGLDVICRGR